MHGYNYGFARAISIGFKDITPKINAALSACSQHPATRLPHPVSPYMAIYTTPETNLIFLLTALRDMTTPDLSIAQLRRALCNNIHQISQSDRQEVLNFALSELPGKHFIVALDGCRLSLGASVPDDVIVKLNALVHSKMCFYDETDFKQ